MALALVIAGCAQTQPEGTVGPGADAGLAPFVWAPNDPRNVPLPVLASERRDVLDVAVGVGGLLVLDATGVARLRAPLTSSQAAERLALGAAGSGAETIEAVPLPSGRVLVRLGETLWVDDGTSLQRSPLGERLGPLLGLRSGPLAFTDDTVFTLTASQAGGRRLPPELGALRDVARVDGGLLFATARGLWSLPDGAAEATLEHAATDAAQVVASFARTVARVGDRLLVREVAGAWSDAGLPPVRAVEGTTEGLVLLLADGRVARSQVERVWPLAFPVGILSRVRPIGDDVLGLVEEGTLGALATGRDVFVSGLDEGELLLRPRVVSARPRDGIRLAASVDGAELMSSLPGVGLELRLDPAALGPGEHELMLTPSAAGESLAPVTVRFEVRLDVPPTYANLVVPLFEGRCKSCHDEGKVARRLDSRARWEMEMDAVLRELRAGRMPLPPYRPVPPSTIELLERWKALSFPE